MKRSIILFLLLYASAAHSLVGFGSYTPAYSRYQSKADGSTSVFQFNPYVSVHTKYPLMWRQSFYPELGLVYHTGLEEEYTKITLFLLYNFGWEIINSLTLRYGLGTFITRIEGDGGTAQLPNGSSTATFYKPGDAEVSYTGSVNLGLEYSFLSSYSVRVDSYLLKPLDADRRTVSYGLSFNYYL